MNASTHRTDTAWIAVLALCGVSSLKAAPASSEEIQATTPGRPQAEQPAGAAPTATVSPPGGGLTQSKTVEMLLHMQDQQASAARDGPAKNGADPSRLPAGKPAQAEEGPSTPLSELKAVVLTVQEIKGPSDPQEAAVRASRALERPESPLPGVKAVAGATSSLVMNPVVRFIRENRELTITACLLALGAIWATARFSMRRRR